MSSNGLTISSHRFGRGFLLTLLLFVFACLFFPIKDVYAANGYGMYAATLPQPYYQWTFDDCTANGNMQSTGSAGAALLLGGFGNTCTPGYVSASQSGMTTSTDLAATLPGGGGTTQYIGTTQAAYTGSTFTLSMWVNFACLDTYYSTCAGDGQGLTYLTTSSNNGTLSYSTSYVGYTLFSARSNATTTYTQFSVALIANNANTSPMTYHFAVYFSDGTQIISQNYPLTSSGSGVGQWYHVVVQQNGSTGALYVNNNLEASTTSVSAAANLGTLWLFGSFWKGSLDQVQFWNSTLTEAQIQQVWNQRPSFNTTYPQYAFSSQRELGYWPLISNATESGGLGTATGVSLSGTVGGTSNFVCCGVADVSSMGTTGATFSSSTMTSITMPTTPLLDPGAGPFSVSAWLSLTSAPTSYTYPILYNGSTTNGRFGLEVGASSVSGQAYVTGWVYTGGKPFCTYTASVPTGAGFHVVVERDYYGNMKLFINGEYVSSNQSTATAYSGSCQTGTSFGSTTVNNTTNGTVVGATTGSSNGGDLGGSYWTFGSGGGQTYPGVLQQVHIYNYALNDDEIYSLRNQYNLTPKAVNQNLTGYWKFAERYCYLWAAGSYCPLTTAAQTPNLVVDSSGLGAPGRIYAGGSYSIGVPSLPASYTFDNTSGGVGRIVIPLTGLNAPGSSAFTYAFWLRRPANISATQNLLSLGGTQATPSFMIKMNASRQIVVSCPSGTTTSAALSAYSNYTGSETSDSVPWAHIAVIRSGTGSTGMQIYVNGVASGSAGTCSDTFSVSSSTVNEMHLGRWMNGSGSTAAMDDLRIYSAAITTGAGSVLNTLASLMGRRIAARYTFDDAAAGAAYSSIADVSGNGAGLLSAAIAPVAVSSLTPYTSYSSSAASYANSAVEFAPGVQGSRVQTSLTASAAEPAALDFDRGNFAISFWTQFSATGTGTGACANGCIMSMGDPNVSNAAAATTTSSGFYVGINSSSHPFLTVFDCSLPSGFTAPQSCSKTVTSSVTVSAGTWYQVTVMRKPATWTDPAGNLWEVLGGQLQIWVTAASSGLPSVDTTADIVTLVDAAGNNYLSANPYTNGACIGNAFALGVVSCIGQYGSSASPAYVDDLRFYRDALGSDEVNSLAIKPGLLGWWKFDDCTVGSACSTSVNSGALGGSASTSGTVNGVTGLRGAAVSFSDTTGLVNLDSSLSDGKGVGSGSDSNFYGNYNYGIGVGAGDFTLAYWVYFPNAPTSTYSMMSARGPFNSGEARMDMGQINGGLFMEIGDGSTTLTGANITTPSQYSYAFAAGQWHHITIMRDASSFMHFYVDGVDQYAAGVMQNDFDLEANIGNISGENGAWRLGSGSNTASAIYDDVRLYNYAVPPARIVQLSTPVGLVGYWKFNETSGSATADAVGLSSPWGGSYGLQGTISGTSSFVSGIRQNAFSFNGSTTVTPVSSSSLSPGDLPFSYSFWVNPAAFSSNLPIMISQGSQTDWNGALNTLVQIGISSTNFPYISIGGSPISLSSAPTGWAASAWSHIVIERNNSNTVSMWVNGVQQSTTVTNATFDLLSTSFPLQFGGNCSETSVLGTNAAGVAQSCGTVVNYDGLMDDTRYYNKTLSATEIANLYSQGLMNDGRVGFYQFEDGSGSTPADSSNWGNNLALSNGSAPTWTTGVRSGGVQLGSTTGFSPVNANYATNANMNFDEFHFGASDFTIGAWVNVTSSGSGIIMRDGAVGNAITMLLNSAMVPACILGGTTVTYTLSTTGWHHVACQRTTASTSSQTLLLYVDGVQQGSASVINVIRSPMAAHYDFSFGWDPSGNAYPGVIDEVRVYDYALSPYQLSIIANKPKLQAYYRFNSASASPIIQGTTTADSGPYGATATFNENGTTYTTIVSGVRGNGIQFNATSKWVTVPSDTTPQLLPGDTAFTWAGWFNITTVTSGNMSDTTITGLLPLLIGLPDGSTTPSSLTHKQTYPRYATDGMCFRVGDIATAGVLGSSQVCTTTTPPSTGSGWHHFAWQRDNLGKLYIYIDGTQYGASTSGGNNVDLSDADEFYLSLPTGWGSNEWQGGVDELRLYNYLLSPAEIQALALKPEAISDYRVATATDTNAPDSMGGSAATFSGISGVAYGVRSAAANVTSSSAAVTTPANYIKNQVGDQAFATSFWVFPTSCTSSCTSGWPNSAVTLLSTGTTSGGNMTLTTQGGSGSLTLTINGIASDNPQDSVTSSALSLNSSTAMTVGQWNNIIIMRDETGAFSLWVNGQTPSVSVANQLWSFDAPYNFSGNTAPWILANNLSLNNAPNMGSFTETDGTVVSGYLFDEWRIYNRVLSPSEIYSLSLLPQLVAYWQMDSNSTCISVVDSTIFANTGTCTTGVGLSNSNFQNTYAVRGDAFSLGAATADTAAINTTVNATSGVFITPTSVNATAANTAANDPLKFMDNTGFTYAAWVWVPATISSSIYIISSGTSTASTGATNFYIDTSGYLHFNITGVQNNDSSLYSYTTVSASTNNSGSNETVTKGAWNHVIFQRAENTDSPCYTFYLNGVASGAANCGINFTLSPISYAGGFNIGNSNAGTNAWTGGTVTSNAVPILDDVRVYNYTISANEIAIISAQPQEILHWKLDETGGATTIVDSSGNALNGTAAGFSSLSSDEITGVRGNALTIENNGSNVSLSLSNAVLAHPGNLAFTWAAWINPASLASSPIVFYTGGEIAYSATPNSPLKVMLSLTTTGSVRMRVGSYTFNSTATIPTNVWSHIAVGRLDNGQLFVYINGTQDTGSPSGSTYSAGAQSVNVNDGGNGNHFYMGLPSSITTTNYFSGAMDDVRIYNYPLSQAQIYTLSLQPQLIGMWKFDDAASGTCTSIADSVGLYTINGTCAATTTKPSFAATGVRGSDLSWASDTTAAVNLPTQTSWATNDALKLGDNGFTYTSWVYVPTSNTSKFYVLSSGTTGNYMNVFVDTTNHVNLQINGVPSNNLIAAAATFTATTSAALTTGAWSHIAVQRSDATPVTYTIYVNGTLASTTTTPATLPTTDANLSFDTVGIAGTGLRFGNSNAQTNATSGWYIDETRVYNYALSANELTRLGTMPSLVGFWKFEEQTRTTTCDMSQSACDDTTATGTSPRDLYFAGTTTPAWLSASSAALRGGAMTIGASTNSVAASQFVAAQQLGDSAFTLAAWVQVPSLATTQYILSSGNTTNGYSLWFDTSNKLNFKAIGDAFSNPALTSGVTVGASQTASVQSSSAVLTAANTWMYVTVVRSEVSAGTPPTYTLYVNGTAVGSSTVNGFTSPNNASYGVQVGNNPGLTTACQGCSMDEVRVYNRALSTAEITRLALAPQNVAYYNMNATSGTTVADSSPNGGSSQNGVLVSPLTASNWTTAGFLGGALSFPSTAATAAAATVGYVQHMTLGDQSLTYTMDFNFSSLPSTRADLFNLGQSDSNMQLWIDSNNKLNFSVTGVPYNNPVGTAVTASGTASSAISANQWYQVTVIRTETGVYNVYLNAANASYSCTGTVTPVITLGATATPDFISSDSAKALANSLPEYTFGNNSITPSTPAKNAILDEVRVYNYAISACQNQAYTAAPALIAWWRLNESGGTSTAVDSSGNGYNGTETGFSTLSSNQVSAVRGNGLLFNAANQYMQVSSAAAESALMSYDLPFTWGAWVNITSLPASGNVAPIMWTGSDGTNTATNATYLALNSSGNLVFQVGSNSPQLISSNNANNSLASTPYTMATGGWHYVIAMRSNNLLYLYVDNTLVAQSATTAVNISNINSSNTFDLNLPNATSTGFTGFLGTVDEARVYNYALASRDMQILSAPPRLNGYWKLDENGSTNLCSSSTTLTCDSTGNGINATLTNFSTPTSDWKAGVHNNSLYFDATAAYLNMTSNALLYSAQQSFTWAAWVYTPGSQGSTTSNILTMGHAASSGYLNCSINTSNQISCALGATPTTLFTYQLATPQWNHVAIQRDENGHYDLYVNGTLVANTSSMDISNLNGTNGSGADNVQWGAPVSGNLDDVRFYNYALTATQIFGIGAPPQLVGYWKFDGNANDQTGYAASPSVQSVTFTATGVRGNAASFTSSSAQVGVPQTALMLLDRPFTFMMWIYPTSFSATQYLYSSQRASATTALNLGMNVYLDTNGKVNFNMTGTNYSNLADVTTATTSLISTSALSLNTWHHIVIQRTETSPYGTGQYQMYVDCSNASCSGQAATASSVGISASVDDPQGSANNVIGNSVALSSPALNTQIDEMRIYNRVLTVDEIKIQATPLQQVAWWSFNESNDSGTPPVADSSPNGKGGGCVNNFASEPVDRVTGVVGNAMYWSVANAYIDANNGNCSQSISDWTRLADLPMTVATWVKLNDIASNHTIIYSGAGSATIPAGASTWSFKVLTGGYLSFEVDNRMLNFPTNSMVVTSTSPVVTPGVFAYVAATRDEAATITLWVNGAAVASTATLNGSTVGSSANVLDSTDLNHGVYIGNLPGDTETFTGTMDELVLYNYPLTAAQMQTNTNARPQLLGWWRFDEGTGTLAYDSSGYGQTATLSGTSTGTWIEGEFDGAYQFDVPTYFDTGTQSALTLGTAFTVATWFRYDGNSTSGSILASWGTMNSGSSTNNGWYISCRPNGSLSFVIAKGSSYNYVEVTSAAQTTLLNAEGKGLWQHIAFARDASNNFHAYLNGVDVTGATSSSGMTLTGTSDLRIGGDANAGTASVYIPYLNVTGGYASFYGALDDFKIFNYAITSTQALQLAQPPIMDLHYEMDNTSGTSVTDSTTNALSGTLTNLTSSNWAPTAGVFNGALNMNVTNGYVSVNDPAQVQMSQNAFTVMAWVKPSSATQNQILFAYGNPAINNVYWEASLVSNGTSLTPKFYMQGYLDGGPTVYNPSTVTIPANQWTHLAYKRAGDGTFTIYVNGVRVYSSPYVAVQSLMDLSATLGNLTIGNYPGSANFFSGYMDEVRVYHRDMTAKEILAQANLNLVGSWSFDNASNLGADDGGVGLSDTVTGVSAVTSGEYNGAAAFNAPIGYKAMQEGGQASAGMGTSSSIVVGLGTQPNLIDRALTLDNIAFSVSTWVYASDIAANSTNTILAFGSPTANNSWTLATSNSGAIIVTLFDAMSSPTQAQLNTSTLTTPYFLPQWSWHNIVVTRSDANVVSLYVDGTAIGTLTLSSTYNLTNLQANGLYIGNQEGTTTAWGGFIDQTKLYNRALSQAEVTALYTGMVGYWTFNDGSGTSVADSSGLGNTGTIYGGAAFQTDGKFAGDLQLSGSNQYINMGSNAPLRMGAGAFTASAWVRFLDNNWKTKNEVLANLGTLGTNGNNWAFSVNSGNLVFSTAGQGVSSSVSASLTTNGLTQVNTGQWHMLTARRDTFGNLSVFLDGLLLQSQASTIANLVDLNVGLVVGADSTQAANFFDGELDDMRLYNYALSNSQVSSLYTTMMGWWKFNQNSNDSSGSGNNGTINTAEYQAGTILNAARFNVDTTNYMTVPMSSSLNLNNTAYTISMWVYPEDTSSAWQTVLTSNNTGQGATGNVPYFALGLKTLGSTKSNKSLFFEGTDGLTAHRVSFNTTGDTITGSTWHHIALVANTTGALSLYIDGAQAASSAGTGGLWPMSTPMQPLSVAGALTNSFVNSGTLAGFDGLVDDLRVYNRAYSATDISQLFQGLVGYWSMNGVIGVSTEAIDSTTSNNHGTLEGGLTASNAWIGGHTGNALNQTTSAEYVYVGNSHEVEIGTDPFAASMLVNLSSNTVGQTLLYYGGTNPAPGWSVSAMAGGAVQFAVSDGTTTDTVTTATGVLTPGKWHTIVVERDDQAVLHIWVDSAATTQTTATMRNVTQTPGAGLYIANAPSANTGFKGYIQQVQLYDRSLTTAEQGDLAIRPLDHFGITGPTSAIRCLGAPLVISALSSTGTVVTSYQGVVTLTTQTGYGTWSLTQSGGAPISQGTLTQSGNDTGVASYTFSPADNGVLYATVTYSDGPSPMTPNVYETSTNTGAIGVNAITFYASGYTLTSQALTPCTLTPSTGCPVMNTNYPIGTQVAGTPFTVNVAAYGTTPTDPVCGVIQDYTGTHSVNLVTLHDNPTSSTTNLTANGSATNPISLNFTAGQATFTAKYEDVGSIAFSVTDTVVPPTSTPISGTSNLFVVKPYAFITKGLTNSSGTSISLTNISDQTAPVLAKAGQNFGVTVWAMSADGQLTPSYGNESPAQGIKIIKSYQLVAPAGGRNGTTSLGTIGGTLTLTGANGVFTASGLSFDEVGIINLQYDVASGSYLNTGDVLTNDTQGIGRFTPDHFDLTETQSGVFTTFCQNFTYLGQAFGLTTVPQISVVARNSNGVQTQNYTAAFNKLPAALSSTTNAYAFAAASSPTGTTLNSSNATSTLQNFINGQGTYQLGVGAGLAFTRPTGDVGVLPFNASIGYSFTLADSDGVSYSGGSPFSVTGMAFTGANAFWDGRYYLSNGYGSDRAPLYMNLTTQYYTATGFITNTADSCTTLPSTATTSGAFTPTVTFAPGTGAPNGSTTFYQGTGFLVLSPPAGGLGATEQPYVDVTLGLNNSFLGYVWPYNGIMTGQAQTQPPTARAFFNGAYSSNRVLQQTELYNNSGM